MYEQHIDQQKTKQHPKRNNINYITSNASVHGNDNNTLNNSNQPSTNNTETNNNNTNVNTPSAQDEIKSKYVLTDSLGSGPSRKRSSSSQIK